MTSTGVGVGIGDEVRGIVGSGNGVAGWIGVGARVAVGSGVGAKVRVSVTVLGIRGVVVDGAGVGSDTGSPQETSTAKQTRTSRSVQWRGNGTPSRQWTQVTLPRVDPASTCEPQGGTYRCPEPLRVTCEWQ